jgi:hypothetical protein
MTRTTVSQIEQRRFEQAIANRRHYRAEPLGTAFAQVLQAGAGGEVDQAALQRAWHEAAPAAVRQATRVELLDGGVLRIAVADPVTRFSLLAQRRLLEDRLRRRLPRLRAVRFSLDENGFGRRQHG